MKKVTSGLVVLLFAAVVGSNAMAATPTHSGRSTFWVGSALDNTYQNYTAFPSISAAIHMGDKSALQMYLGIPTVNPFAVGGGAAFKYTVSGNNVKGFHVGAGLGLGAGPNA